MAELVVARDFSKTPGGRYVSDGPSSGEEFRESFLIPRLETGENLTIVLDGARGYPSSFLDEAFAGLIRKLHWTKAQFDARIQFSAQPDYRIYVDDINSYVTDQLKRS